MANTSDSGTNDPVKTTKQTQATPPAPNAGGGRGFVNPPNATAQSGAGGGRGFVNPPYASSQSGAGAPSEDAGTKNVTKNDKVINTAGNNPITPQPNILDQYASYTYSLSWYALTASQVKTMFETSKIDTNQWSLLMQSGGASIQTNSVNPTTTTSSTNSTTSNATNTSGRNKYFSLDYYMDDLEITSAFMDKGPSSATDLSFTVTEPNGITLIMNLNNALRDLLQQPKGSVGNAIFVMVIRFYGYDALGNLVTNIGQSASPDNTNYVVIKYYPFTIAELTFTMASKAVVYHIKGTIPAYNYAKGSALGSVPYNVELSGETVTDVLNGKVVNNATSNANDGRSSTGSPSVATGPQNPTNQANSAAGLGTAVLTGGSYNPETGAVGYAFGA